MRSTMRSPWKVAQVSGSSALWLLLVAWTWTASAFQQFDWLSGGTPLPSIATAPYVAAWVSSDGEELYCMATIISQRTLVTSARCIEQYMLRNIGSTKNESFIAVGVSSSEEWKSHTYSVAYMVPYPRFTEGNMGYVRKDIGLIFTSEDIEFSTSVRATQVPNFDPPPGYNMTVTGYGASKTLLTGRMQHLNDQDPNVTASFDRTYPDEMLFGPDNSSESVICDGVDTATPAVLSNYLFAIATHSSGTASSCGSPVPRVFTRVAHYSAWIASMQAMFETTGQGSVSYTVADKVILSSSLPTAAPTKARLVKKGGKKGRSKKRKPAKVITPPRPIIYSLLIPRGLRSVTFQLLDTTSGLPIDSSFAEFQIWLAPRSPSAISSVCVSDHTESCSLFAPLEGIYEIEIRSLPTPSASFDVVARLEARFEHLNGYRMVRSVYNESLPPKRTESYLSIPVVPGSDFSAKLLPVAPSSTIKQRLVVASSFSSTNPFCSKVATISNPADCQFQIPQNVTSMVVTVMGDPKRRSDFGLEFTYPRYTQTNSKPGSCSPGFPCRAHYTVAAVPKGTTKQFRKAVTAGTEFGVQFDAIAGQIEVRVFFGEDDSSPLANVECLLTGASTVPGKSHFCSIMVPQTVTGEVRVFVTTTSRTAASYEMTMLY